MGPTSDRVCFLTQMSGDFEGGGEVVRTFDDGGSWYLGGYSMQQGVHGSARCTYVSSPSSYTGNFLWTQDQWWPTYMGPADGRACFLTWVSGHFEGGGEVVQAYVSGGSWYLFGHSMQQQVSAMARCVNVRGYTGEYTWNQGSYSVYMGPTWDRDCYLTRVTGKFKGGGEYVHAFDNGWGSWYLGGGSMQAQVGASARCIFPW